MNFYEEIKKFYEEIKKFYEEINPIAKENILNSMRKSKSFNGYVTLPPLGGSVFHPPGIFMYKIYHIVGW